MRVLVRIFQLFLQLFAERFVDVVLDAVGRDVDMVGRQAEVFYEVAFPKAVASYQPGGAPAAVVSHMELAAFEFDAAASAKHPQSPTSE